MKRPLTASGKGATKTKTAAYGEAAVYSLWIYFRLQNYVYIIDIKSCERTRDNRSSLCTEVVGIEDDVVSVAVFEALLRLECFAEVTVYKEQIARPFDN